MPIALEAVRQGKHVLVTKPLADSEEAARRLVEVAEAADVVHMMSLSMRFADAVQYLGRLVRAGEFGELYYARARSIRRSGIPDWNPGFIRKGGGAFRDMGVQYIRRIAISPHLWYHEIILLPNWERCIMRVLSKKTLRQFWEKHPDAEQPLLAWYHDARRAHWGMPSDIKDVYGNASILHNNRVVFNIGGNKYRLVVWVQYQYGCVYIRFIGTHQEYNTIDANTI